jgi:TonB-linked SusC/RagA family outer membrane protein
MKKILLLTMLLIMSISVLSAQQRVTGKVTSAEDGTSIAFVTVVVSGTTITSQTNVNGDYSITVPSGSNSLTFSFIGLKTVTVDLNGRAVVNVQMSPEAVALEDVIVVAYGTAKKESFTGSAQVIKSEKLERRTVANVTKAIDGMATGVQTTLGSGQPGSGVSVVIRGQGSIKASNTPLYVVDGVPYDGAINAINPHDIANMTVIKDASAGALYGARAANGVVMITTKKGQEGKVTVSFKGNFGTSSRAIPRYEAMDAYGWTENVYFMYKNRLIFNGSSPEAAGPLALIEMSTGSTKIFGANEQYNPFSRAAIDLIDHSTGRIYEGTTLKWNEDWLDLSTDSFPIRQEYQMTVSGGSEKTKYMFSAGYLNEEGLVIGTNFERFSGRANVDSQINEWFKTGLNVNFAGNTTNSTTLSLINANPTSYANVFSTCMMMGPIYPMYQKDASGNTVYDENGDPEYDWGDNRPAGAAAGWNPRANLEEDKYLGLADNVSARTYMELGNLKEGALKGLKLAVNFGFDYINSKTKTYYNPVFGNGRGTKGYLAVEDRRTFSYTFNQLLTWDRSFGLHHFDILAGHELYKYNYQYLAGGKTGFPFSGLYELDAATTISAVSSYTNNYVIESFLSRFNYDYKDKYYFSGSYRKDGTSRFNEAVRWGDFWSVGASWRISQESFLAKASWLNNLTLKASYGIQGNDAVGTLYAWQAFYTLEFPNGANPGAAVSSLENKDLKWEKNENLNIGIEGRLLDRLSVSAEFYNRFTRDMLMDYPMALSLGFDGYSKNIGNMKNSGFEVSLSMDVIKKSDFYWNMTLMGSTIKNKVINLADKPEIISGDIIIREGEALNSFYLAHSAGVDPATGTQLYWVWDEDEEGNRGERYISSSYTKAYQCRDIAGSRMPSLYGSFANDFKIGDFDLSIMTTYSLGGKIIDQTYTDMLYNNYVGEASHVDAEKSWRKPGDVTSIPRIDLNGIFQFATTADQLTDASYFAIKNISLGYNFPSKWMKVVKLQSARVSLTADNLYVFTARKGLNPQYDFTGGTDYEYTPTRTFSVGLELNF